MKCTECNNTAKRNRQCSPTCVANYVRRISRLEADYVEVPTEKILVNFDEAAWRAYDEGMDGAE